jgi:hypothetical protein
MRIRLVTPGDAFGPVDLLTEFSSEHPLRVSREVLFSGMCEPRGPFESRLLIQKLAVGKPREAG